MGLFHAFPIKFSLFRHAFGFSGLNPKTVWDAAEYDGVKWQRFESIPSSMFFTLLNLCKEHPLADSFGAEGNSPAIAFFQRLIVVVVCIVGVPVFGVPTGILGASLMKHCRPLGNGFRPTFV